MSTTKAHRVQRNGALAVLIAHTFLQPTQSAAFINFQNRDRCCDHSWRGVVLNIHQMIQCRDDPHLVPNLRIAPKFCLGSFMETHHGNYIVPRDTKIAGTTLIDNLNVVRDFLIWQCEIAHSEVGILYKIDDYRVARFDCLIITARIKR